MLKFSSLYFLTACLTLVCGCSPSARDTSDALELAAANSSAAPNEANESMEADNTNNETNETNETANPTGSTGLPVDLTGLWLEEREQHHYMYLAADGAEVRYDSSSNGDNCYIHKDYGQKWIPSGGNLYAKQYKNKPVSDNIVEMVVSGSSMKFTYKEGYSIANGFSFQYRRQTGLMPADVPICE